MLLGKNVVVFIHGKLNKFLALIKLSTERCAFRYFPIYHPPEKLWLGLLGLFRAIRAIRVNPNPNSPNSPNPSPNPNPNPNFSGG